MKALIIEDEAPAVRRLKNLLEQQEERYIVLDEIDSVEDALEWLEQNPQPDVIFSDIQLADGLSFEIYEKHQLTCPIIFTTAYDEYAVKAFEHNGIDYLLKPYSEEQLTKALERLKQFQPQQSADLSKALEQISVKRGINQEFKSRFLISKADSLIPVKVNEVAYIFTEDKAVMLMTKENIRYFINYTLDELEELLDPKYFFRLNRQFIVHIDSILKISNYFNGKLKVELHPNITDEVVVSRAKSPILKSWLEQ
jgi:DNA-binding LytR/AlgR family response regulator